MKTRLTFLILAALHLTLGACTTARKNRTAGGAGGVVNLLAVAEPVSEAEIQSLKAIADSPASMLPSAAEASETTPLVAESKPMAASPATVEDSDLKLKWKRPGLNPDEVNPGDIFSENNGSVLHKALSLADELPSAERRALLNYYTTIKTSRVPMKVSRREIGELESLASTETPLPSRSVTYDFRSENRTVAPERLETLFDQLSRSEPVDAVENKDQQARLKSQLASVKKRLQSGERLYIVTAITESEGVTATFPGASVEGSDPESVANVLRSQYPHLNSIEAQRQDDKVLITGRPRILWKYEASEIVLKDGRVTIDSPSVAQL